MPPEEDVTETETETTEVRVDKPTETRESESTPLKDWRDHISDQKLRDSTVKYTSLNALVEAHNHLSGELKTRVKLPGKDATDEDVAKFRKSLNVPAKAEDYKVTSPEGMQYDEADQAVIAEFAELALENNIPAPAFDKFMQLIAGRAKGLRESVVEEIEDAREEAEEALEKEWGKDLDKNVAMATRASKAHGGDRFVKFLNQTKVEGHGLLGDHPEMVRFLANIGSKSDENDIVLRSTSDERQTAQARINEIHEKYSTDSSEYKSKAVQKELGELYAKVYGEHPVVGAAVR